MSKPFRKIISGLDPVNNNLVEVDETTNRNTKMIQTLMRSDVNGVFLFYTEKTMEKVSEGIMLPPGLSDENVHMFKIEFMQLFEKYASKVGKNGN